MNGPISAYQKMIEWNRKKHKGVKKNSNICADNTITFLNSTRPI